MDCFAALAMTLMGRRLSETPHPRRPGLEPGPIIPVIYGYEKSSNTVLERGATAYGSRLKAGTTASLLRSSRFKFQTADASNPPAARGARGDAFGLALKENQRAQETPGARGTRDPCAKNAHGGPQVPGTPGVPCAMALRLMARSPRRRTRFCHRRLRIDGFAKPGWAAKTSAGLTSATDARTTRFCRTQRPSSTQVRAAVCDLPTCGEGVETPVVCAPADRSQAKPALPPPCAPNAAASTASPTQRP